MIVLLDLVNNNW